MSTFYIPAPFDESHQVALDHLIDSLQTLYPGLLQTSPALAITTDVPEIVALFKSLDSAAAAAPPRVPKTSKAARIVPDNHNPVPSGDTRLCRQCGEKPATDKKLYGFCSKECMNHYYGERRTKKRRNSNSDIPAPAQKADPILKGELGVWREDPEQQGTIIKQLMEEAGHERRGRF